MIKLNMKMQQNISISLKTQLEDITKKINSYLFTYLVSLYHKALGVHYYFT